jgi:hypothetical protein
MGSFSLPAGLLAPFVEFLLSRRADFQWRPDPAAIRHDQLVDAAFRRMRELAPRHVEPPQVFVGREEEEGA